MSRPISVLFTAAALFMLSISSAFAMPMLSGKDTMDHWPRVELVEKELVPVIVESTGVTIATIAYMIWLEERTFEYVETLQIGGWDNSPRFFLAEVRYRSLEDFEGEMPYGVWIDACVASGEAPCGEGKEISSGAEAVALIESYFSKISGHDAKIILE